MGSARISNTTNMADDKKKSIKGLIKNIFGKKKEKCKEKDANWHKTNEKGKEIAQNEQIIINPVDTLLQNFKKLEIEKQKKEVEAELKNFSFQKVEEDELDNFTFSTVTEERKTERTESHSSQDSGFSDVTKSDDDVTREDDVVIQDEETDENETKDNGNETDQTENNENKEETLSEEDKKAENLLEGLENLKIDDGKKKKCKVPVARTPIRNKVGDFIPTLHPYGLDTAAGDYRQINQVNKQTWSGGHVVCRDYPHPVTKPDTTQELQHFSDGLALRGVQLEGPPFELDLIQEYINEDIANTSDLLDEFIKDPNNQEQIQTITTLVETEIDKIDPIEELENSNHLNYEQISKLDSLIGFEEDKLYANIYPTPPGPEIAHSPMNEQFYSNFLTPPRSDVASSPMSDPYPTNSEYSLSPNSDCEKYQDIPQFYEELIPEEEVIEKKERERNASTSSLSMKNFKDLQRELSGRFSKKECCQINRKPVKQIFAEHLKKLEPGERKALGLKVVKMDLTTCYGVLHHILLGLSRGTQEEDLHLALFALICERVLAENAAVFAGDFGLSILKAAALRCPDRALMTRYVVHCIRIAIKQDTSLVHGKDCLFKEVDAQGDTLVLACARAGGEYAAVLSELVRREHNDAPLFNVHHTNTEGYSALQVACRSHSSLRPSLHTVHVLLEHGAADIWKGDVKGGDTAVHMAVNSPSTELHLVLLLFKHLDRKEWKKLAHVANRSSVTPLDYARCAVKSTTRQNYPTEVLDFLKKCR